MDALILKGETEAGLKQYRRKQRSVYLMLIHMETISSGRNILKQAPIKHGSLSGSGTAVELCVILGAEC